MRTITRISFKALDLLVIFVMVFGSPMSALAQDPGPVLSIDKSDYAPGEHVQITGTGFVDGDYAISASGPDGTLDWGTATAVGGGFVTNSPELAAAGAYEVQAYAAGDHTVVASVGFTVTAPPDSTEPPTATESPTAEPTATETPTATEPPTATDAPTATEPPTAVVTEPPTATDTPTATEPPTATESPTATHAPTDTPTTTQEPTLPPTDTPTATQAPTDTATASPTATNTSVPTASGSPTIQSDQADYNPGQLVTLTGANWQGDTAVIITVVDAVPTVYHDTDQVQVQADGTITDSFNLPTTFVDRYFVTAKGVQTGRTATATFTDANPSANIDQCANDSAPSPSNDGCDTAANQWVNGNLGASKSLYFEGDSIPYRITFDNLSTSGTHTISIKWDTTKSGTHALDYLTTFNRSVLDANPCLGVSGCTFPGSPSTFPIPADPQVTGAGVTPIAGNFTLYGGTITAVSAYSYPDGTGFAGDKSAAITITFSASVANPVLAWGGHISTRANWGANNSAVAISGSPYHTALIALDGSGGAQDRSLSADAVIFPGSITIIKDAVPNGSTSFSFTGSPSPLASFSLTDDGTSANKKVFSNITNFQTYTINETTIPSGWDFTSAACSVTSPNGGSSSVTGTTATVTMAEGENYTCTYVNTQRGTIIVEKQTNPDGALGNFTFTGTAAGTISDNGQITVPNLVPGTYTSTENDPSSTFSLASIVCNDGTSANPSTGNVSTRTATFKLDPGETVKCTFTNTLQQGTVIVKKVMVGGTGTFNFSGTPSGSISTNNGTISANVTPGTYTTTETALAGWDLTGISCDDSNSTGNVSNRTATFNVSTSEVVTCTFTNTKQNPALTLAKSATPTTYSAVGQVINYSYLVTNSGNVKLAGPVTVTDNKATVTCPNVNTVGNLDGFLDPGESLTCTASYTITQADLNAGSVTNTAQASAGGTNSNQDSKTVTATQNSALTLVKSATPSTYSSVGQTINYSYLVTNSGNVRLAGPVTVVDNKATVTCPNVNTVGNNDSFLDPGESVTCTATYTITQADLNNGSVTNTAQATAGGTNSNQDSKTVSAVQSPALTLDKTATETSYNAVGNILHYSYLVTNNGNVRLPGPVTVTDNKASVTCPNVNTVGNLDGFLDPGESITCTASYTVTQADINSGSVTNVAQAHAGSTNSNTDTVTVNAVQSPVLTLDKKTATTSYASVGDTISYTYDVTNTGNVRLAGPVTVTDDKTTVICPNVNTVGNTDSFLDPGETITCTASYSVTQADLNAGSVTNTATAHAGGTDSNTDSTTVNAVQTRTLSLVKTATPATYSVVGDVISYSYKVTNTGNVTLVGPVNVTDDKATVSCPAGSLAPGTFITCTASYTITQMDLDNGSVKNTAQAHANGVDSNFDDETVTATQTRTLSLVKTAAPATYSSVGDVISYSYKVTNTGNVTLAGPVTVTDDKATVSCPAGGLAPGAFTTCTASYTITQADLDNGSVKNTAQAHANGIDSNFDDETVMATQTRTLSLVKTATPATYSAAGDVIGYSYVVKNTGNVTLPGPITVTDDKATVSCPAGGLAPGASTTCTASHTITQADLDAGSLTNTAQAHANGVDSNFDDETVTAVQSPALSLVKTATPATYSAIGDVISYSYVVKNTGNVTLAGPVTVTDDKATVSCPAGGLAPGASITCTASYTISQADLDSGSVKNTAQAHANGTDSNFDDETATAVQTRTLSLVKTATPATYSAVGDVIGYSYVVKNTGNVTLAGPITVTDDKATVTCPAGGLAPGASLTCSAMYPITQADLDAGSVTNTAQAHANSVDSNTDTETVNAIQSPALSLTKSADPITYSTAGQTITYTYVIKNTGNVTLAGPFTVSDNKATVACPATASLAPGASIACSATYTITQADLNAGSVTNKATATNGTVTSNEATATVTATQSPALSLTKSADPTTYSTAGQIITYSYLLKNTGNVTLSGPFSVSDDKATVSCPATPTSLAPGDSITCSATYTITQADLDAGSVTNTAKGKASFNGNDVFSNEDTVTVTAQANPALTLDKTADPIVYSTVGDTISYSYLLTNTGNVTLSSPFTVSDDKVSVTCPAAPTSLPPSASITCTATYMIEQADLDAGSVTNTATGHGFFGTTLVDSNEDSTTVNASQSPALTLDKTADPMSYSAVGDIISYSYLLTNTGNVTLSGPFTVADDKTTVTCPATPTSLAPNDSVTCTATYIINQADVDAGFVKNTAKGHAFFGAEPVDSNTDSATVTAQQRPALSLDKTADPTNFSAVGDEITYSYLLTNSGNVTLSGPFTVTDDKATVSCPATVSLAPGDSITCTATYVITLANLDDGFVKNTAQGHAFFGTTPVDSNEDSAIVDAIQSPALTLDKTADPLTYDSTTDVIGYNYNLKNTGNVTLFGPFTVTDDKAAVTCPVTVSLAPNASIDCTATYVITQADLNAGSVTNTAKARGSFNGNDVFSNQDSTTVTAQQSPALALEKTASPATYSAVGDEISYSYLLTNSGNVTLSGPFTVSDDKALATCPATASLAPGASITCSASYTIGQPDLDAGSVTNTAMGHAFFSTTPVDSNEAKATVTAVQSPAINLVKTVTSTGPYDSVGDTITYQLVAQNTGNVTLSNVSISDPLLGTLTCTEPVTLAPGETLTCTGSYMVAQGDLDTGKVDNTATVKGTPPTGDDVTDTDSQSVSMTQSSSLVVDKALTNNADEDKSGTVSLNDTLTYTITATNNGNVTLHHVTVTDSLTGNSTSCASVAPTATCVLTVTYVVTQADVDAGNIHNVGTADSDETPPTEDTNDVPVPQHPAIDLTKEATPHFSDPVKVGDTIDYTLTATNTGNVTLTNVSISDALLGSLACTPAQPSTLAPKETLVCTGTYAITQADINAGKVNNTGIADSDQTPPTETPHEEPVPQSPHVTLTKVGVLDMTVVAPNDRADVGDVINYTLTATNDGNVTLTNVTITDTLLASLTCTPDQPATLAPKETLVCTGSYTLTLADLNAGKVDNTATADSDQTPPTDTPNEVPVPQAPALSLTKVGALDMTVVAPNDRADVGDVINYTLTVTNDGNVTLLGVTISDPLLPTLSCTPSQPAMLLPGKSLVCTGSYILTQADLDAGNVHNVATGSSQQTPPTETPNDVPVPQAPAINLVKTVTSTGPYDSVGDLITYKLVATNIGNVTLSNVSISDPLLGTLSCIQPVTLAPTETLTCTGSYSVQQTDLDAGKVDNTATTTGSFGDKDYTDSDSQSVPLTQSPAISLVKSAAPSTYNAVGQTITYSYVITNTGNATLPGPFTVADNKASVTCDTTPANGLAPLATLNCAATYTITQADLDAGSVTNKATASTMYHGNAVTSNEATATVTADQKPALTIDKTASESTYSAVGNVIHYSYLVTNSGNVTLFNITVTDNKAAVTCPSTSTGLVPLSTITCTASYTITQADLDAGSLTNLAYAKSGNTQSPPDTVTVPATQTPALTIDKTATESAYSKVGDVIHYSYVVTNSGNVTLYDIAVTDNKATVSCPDTSGGLAPTKTVTCTASYTITQADLDAGSLTNSAYATSGNTQSPPDTVTVPATQSPALTLLKTATPTTYSKVGDVIHYSYKLTNSGNVTLSGPFTVTDNKATVTCPSTASLAPGAFITCTATYTITQADLDSGSVTNTAKGKGSFNGNDVFSNEDSETVTAVQNPSISINKTTNGSDGIVIPVGSSITWTYVVTNAGNVTLTSVSVSDNNGTPANPADDFHATCPKTILAPGESMTCTATGTAQAGHYINTGTATGKPPVGNNVSSTDESDYFSTPRLIIIKHVINNSGGNKTAADFTLDSGGTNDTPSNFAGSEAGTTVTLDAGSYNVTETGPSGYSASYSADCSGTIANGQTKTCTVTNDDQPGTLIVKKVVVNDNGGTKIATNFSFQVNGGTTTSFLQDGSDPLKGKNTVTVNAGTYNVTEPAVSGYTTTYDNCSNVAVANGGTQTCTITNDDQPGTLIVKKVVINDNGGTKIATDFSFQVNGGSATSFLQDGSDPLKGKNTVTVNAGTYNVTEPAVSGYSTTYSTCSNVQVVNGGSQTCTITNNDIAPSLTLDKIVVNNNGGTAAESAWTLTANGGTAGTLSGPGASGHTDVVSGPTFKAGTYALSESTGLSGYSPSSWSCVKNSGAPVTGSSITLGVGDTATCTITNDDIQPKLIVIKHVVGGQAVASSFTMSVTGSSPSPASFPGAESPGTTVNLNAGSYNVTETGPAGYNASFSSGCSGSIAVGETKTCTVTNTFTDYAQIAPTGTTCNQYVNGTAVDFNVYYASQGGVIQYSVQSGKINQTNPGVFFYYTGLSRTITGSGPKTVYIDQSDNSSVVGAFTTTKNDVKLWLVTGTSCTQIQLQANQITLGSGANAGDVTVNFTAAAPAGSYYVISVQYSTGSVVNTNLGASRPTVKYTFTTNVGGGPIEETDIKGITLAPK